MYIELGADKHFIAAKSRFKDIEGEVLVELEETNNMTEESSGKKVIIIEDDEFLLRAAGDTLKREGFDVFSAKNGEEAMEIMKNNKPDLVLLDIILPVKNGFDTLAEMKSDPTLKNIPVIILSCLGQESDIKKARALGAVDFLIKSDTPIKEVVEKVKFYLAKSRSV